MQDASCRQLSSGVRPRDPIPPLKDQIARLIVDRLPGWTQTNAAALLETDQPRVSDLRDGNLERFSLEQLVRLMSRLGGDVQLTVAWDPRRRWIAAEAAFPAFRETGPGPG